MQNFNLHDNTNNIINDNKIINIESRITTNNLVIKLKEFFIKSINYALENNKKDLQNITNGLNELNITGTGNSNDIVISNVHQNVNLKVTISNDDIKLKIIYDIIFDLNLSLFNFFNNVKNNLINYTDTSLVTTINTINYFNKKYNINKDQITDYFIMKQQIQNNNNEFNNYLKNNYNIINTINLPYNMLNDINKMINFDIMGIAINRINSNGSVSDLNQTPIMGDIVSKMFNKTIDDSLIINFINGYKQNFNFILNKITDKNNKIKFYLNSLLTLVMIDNYIEVEVKPEIIVPSVTINNNNYYLLIGGISFCICIFIVIIIFLFK